MDLLSTANTKFCLDFFNVLRTENTNKSIFFSPISISAALGMVLLGARGNTAKQIKEVGFFHFIGMGLGGVIICYFAYNSQNSKNILTRQKLPCYNDQIYKIHILFFYFDPFFQHIRLEAICTKTLYHAELEEVDFRNAPLEARIKINSWVENKTNELFPSNAIDENAVLVLVNAIYFKGKWALEFVKEKTKETAFRVNKVQYGQGPKKIRSEPHLEVLELPYIDNELSMFILLPKDIGDNSTGLEQLESALTYEKLAEWTSSANTNKQNVNVYLPRFKIEEGYNLKSSLQAMGVLDVFSLAKSDLTGISKSVKLYVSRALHKSYVDVNEEGTEASAGTGVVISRTSAHDFKVDHPFLFFIKHNPTNSILFYGRWASPLN
uniref:Ovalbumin-related protein X-like n=1 Tax=Crocodylus porosus TaxID=8502 RepID=A0A7M4FI54_CROPO